VKVRLGLLFALTACDPVLPGTGVGNPGKLAMDATEIPPDVTLERAVAEVTGVEIVDCEGGSRTLSDGAEADLLAANEVARLPGGEWCALELDLGPVQVEGRTDGGTTFTVELLPEPVAVEREFAVDGQTLLLSVPLALDAAALEALGPDVEVSAEEPLALDLADGVAGADLWVDVDGDHEIGEGDVLAALDDTGLPAAPERCGCGAGTRQGPEFAASLALAAVLLRRRRRAGSPKERS
jgi:uncharacterized protein (TIGR03382 family)